ncbi:unnamed protein product [Diamesa serratosioi]
MMFFKMLLGLFLDIVAFFFGFFHQPHSKGFSGHLAVVTGGANKLGRAIALRLAKEKCNVAIVDVDIKAAQSIADEITQLYDVKAKAFKVDVSNYEAVQNLKVELEKSMGTVDVLVNNAELMPAMYLHQSDPEMIQKVINFNLTSHFWTCRTFLEGMRRRKRGHIVAVSSITAKVSLPLTTAFTASKWGVDGMMSALQDELLIDECYKFIKLTTVYPTLMDPSEELQNIMGPIKEIIPNLTPTYIADEIYKAMTKNTRKLTIPCLFSFAKITQ